MMQTAYGELVTEQLVTSLMKSKDYKESPAYAAISQSYQAFKNYKDKNAVLLTYKNINLTYADLKKEIESTFKTPETFTVEDWKGFTDFRKKDFVYKSYNDLFSEREDIKPEIDELKRNLYSQYIFTQYLKSEVEKNPQKAQDYFKNNPEKYMWEQRAESRVAIISDTKLVKEIQKDIENPKNWETLKAKYDKKLNAKNQILVHFETGKVPESGEIFEVNKVPFKKGVFTTKIKDRDVVISVDNILPETHMTYEEAKDYVADDVTEVILRETITNQKAKTKITVEPGFVEALSKTFKK